MMIIDDHGIEDGYDGNNGDDDNDDDNDDDDDDDDADDNSSSPCKTVANLLGELRCLKDYSTKSNVAHIAANDKYGSNSCK